ncbi:MAG: sodium:solute symporter family protein [Candidatus Thermoplasmatota archaeon]
MIFFAIVIGIYFVSLILLGFFAHKKTKKSPEDYFLADRSFGTLILFFTLISTNFSAFTFLGFAGNSYKNGLGQFGIMGLGTGLMAIMFYVIGRKIWLLGKDKGYVTPPELIGDLFQSKSLGFLFMFVMVVFTIPYLAVQAIGAGYLIEIFTNSLIGWKIAAVATILVIMIYVMFGGMRGSGWTDFFQGIIMMIAMSLAFFSLISALGGFENANILAYQAKPELFSRPGGNSFFIPQIWFSFMLLWLFADPMFPQLFSRFYTARSISSLKKSMILYPLVVSFLFLFPVLIGVWAHGVNLNVPSGNEDMVLPLMVENFAPTYVYALVMIGALSALMSTADSQLLSLSTILSRDIPFLKKIKSELFFVRIIVVLLSFFAIFYVVLGYDPSVGIMNTLVQTTFPGLAVLCPTTIAGLYWKNSTKYGCITSIILGEISVFLFQFEIIPDFGFLPAIWAILIAVISLILVSYITLNYNK